MPGRPTGEIAFSRWLAAGGVGQHSQIYVMNADGSGQRRLTSIPAKNIVSGWLPDGKLTFMSWRGNRDFTIYVMNPDGSGQRNLTRNPARIDDGLVWSPAQKKQ